eukprot:15444596-Alexandrium_andersonii.AAC.1
MGARGRASAHLKARVRPARAAQTLGLFLRAVEGASGGQPRPLRARLGCEGGEGRFSPRVPGLKSGAQQCPLELWFPN